MKCLLVGNFGVGNLGDEALKEYFLTAFPDVSWAVVSADPTGTSEVARLPCGIRSFFHFRWIHTLRVLHTCDAVVFGGGSLFTDTESVMACVLWSLHAGAASAFGKPVHLAFQGIGPFRTRTGRMLTRWVCRRAATISVRDDLSAKRVGKFGLYKKCVQSFDPVFSLFKEKKLQVCSKNILTVIPRKNSNDKLTITVQKHVQSMHPERVQILSMQPDNTSEILYCQNLASFLDVDCEVQMIRTIDDLLQHISSSQFVISERYHGALAALALNVPVEIVSQREGDKLSQLTQLIDADDRIRAGVEEMKSSLYSAIL